MTMQLNHFGGIIYYLLDYYCILYIYDLSDFYPLINNKYCCLLFIDVQCDISIV